jgi:uncharacterized membrane protein YraQ (UPF0718 family)
VKRFLKRYSRFIWISAFVVATVASFLIGFDPGQAVFTSFRQALFEMLTFVPFIFIIVGLFDVWVPKDKIERHIGKESGLKGIVLVTLLAMLQAGPLYATFPVAYLMHKKGASVRNIFIYLGVFSCLKVPLLGIEIGYLGLKFSLVRTLVTLPLFIAIGYFMEWYLRDKHFEISDGKEKPKQSS